MKRPKRNNRRQGDFFAVLFPSPVSLAPACPWCGEPLWDENHNWYSTLAPCYREKRRICWRHDAFLKKVHICWACPAWQNCRYLQDLQSSQESSHVTARALSSP